MTATSGLRNWLAAGAGVALLALLTGCGAARQPVSRAMEPTPSAVFPAAGSCGLAGYPVSRPTREILAEAVPTGALRTNSTMLAKVAIDGEGQVTHLKVVRLAYPQASNAVSLNMQAVDAIKHWHYAPTLAAGRPVAVCADANVAVDFR